MRKMRQGKERREGERKGKERKRNEGGKKEGKKEGDKPGGRVDIQPRSAGRPTTLCAPKAGVQIFSVRALLFFVEAQAAICLGPRVRESLAECVRKMSRGSTAGSRASLSVVPGTWSRILQAHLFGNTLATSLREM